MRAVFAEQAITSNSDTVFIDCRDHINCPFKCMQKFLGCLIMPSRSHQKFTKPKNKMLSDNLQSASMQSNAEVKIVIWNSFPLNSLKNNFLFFKHFYSDCLTLYISYGTIAVFPPSVTPQV